MCVCGCTAVGGEAGGTRRSKVRGWVVREGKRARSGPRRLRPLRAVPALPHRGARPLAGSPGGRPNAAEPVNPFRPTSRALAVPRFPPPHRPTGSQGSQRSLRGRPEAGMLSGWSTSRPARLGPAPATGCVTLGNQPHLAEPPPLIFSAVKRSE